jgi:hypothetical protein
MAENAPNRLTYYLQLPKSDQKELYAIRLWSNLKVAIEENSIWITGFLEEQLDKQEIKALLERKMFVEREGKLFLLGSLLPERSMPALLWSPLNRLLTIELPDYNHHYFGISGEAKIKLVPSNKEQTPMAVLVSMKELEVYLQKTARIRFENLHWIQLEDDAMVVGKPLLAMPGNVFWKSGAHFLPAGFDFELSSIGKFIHRKLDPENTSFLFWNEAGHYQCISKNNFQPLTLSSFRLSNREK